MTIRTSQRVPGVYIQDVEPAFAPGLPPLHVAAFVGYAHRGPVDRPVRIDDPADLTGVLGGDGSLVDVDGNVVRPLLRRSAEAFFENGGRRCWVVRVAGTRARRAVIRFDALTRKEDGSDWALEATSEGAWGNALRIVLRLAARPRETAHVVPEDEGLGLPPGAGWRAGELVRVHVGDRADLFLVERVDDIEPDEGTAARLRARGEWVGDSALPWPDPPAADRIEVLTMEVEVRGSGVDREVFPGLGFHPAHPRYAPAVLAGESRLVEPVPGTAAGTLIPDLASAPKGSRPPDGSTTTPRAVPRLLAEARGPATDADRGADDLGGFDRSLFAPPRSELLGGPGLEALAARAREDARRAARGRPPNRPVALRGFLSLLTLDEVGLAAVPDALHLAGEGEPALPVSAPQSAPEAEAEPPEPEEPRPAFHRCSTEEDPAVPPPEEPEEPEVPDWSPPPSSDLPGFRAEEALAVQRALVRLCQHRGDVVAVLGVPRFRDPLRWKARLLEGVHDSSYAALYHPWLRVPDPDAPDGRSHRSLPPSGPACGVIARRELARGVWVGPANEPVRGVLRLVDVPGREAWAHLLHEGINLIRPFPDDFRVMSARTLSRDRHLSQLNVRRLLITLKKALLDWGRDFTFEPHDHALRQAVKRRIEVALERIYRRGAFVGRTPETSFQVLLGEEVNPRPSVDAGRLVALVKVAPSWPMEFLEIRLIRTGEGLLRPGEA